MGVLLPVASRPSDRGHGWQRAVWWFVPVGLITGLAWAGVFRVSWRLFGEAAGLCPIPALMVVLVDAAFLSRRQYWGLGRLLARGDEARPALEPQEDRDARTAQVLVLALVVLAMWVLLVSVPKGPGWWPTDWRARWHLTRLYPRPVYRPLILAPMWGRWAVLMAANVGRTRPGSAATEFCAAVRPGVVLLNFLPVVGLTAVYCSRGGNPLLGVIIGLVVLGVTHLTSTLVARGGGGQSFVTLFAVSKVAELTFLLAYVMAAAR